MAVSPRWARALRGLVGRRWQARGNAAVVGRSGMVLWDPRGDQSPIRSSTFHAVGREWFVNVHTHAKEGSPATLAVYLHMGCSYFAPSMDMVRCSPDCV